MKLQVVLGDITTEDVDVIVNAANSSLLGGGGVDGAIHEAAGSDLLEACRALEGCATGEAKITPGFNLRARWIAHAVGPVWHGGDRGEPELLASCYRESLSRADEIDARSVAFPSISTGAFGYPLRPATRIALRTVRSSDTQVEVVRFVCFDEFTQAVYEELLRSVSP